MHFTVSNFIKFINVEWNHIEIFYTEFYPNQDRKMEVNENTNLMQQS